MASFNKTLKQIAKRKPTVRLDSLEPPAPESVLGVTKAPEVAPPSERDGLTPAAAVDTTKYADQLIPADLAQAPKIPAEQTGTERAALPQREGDRVSESGLVTGPTIKRDGFGFPLNDYKLLEKVIDRCLRAGCKTNKSEIVRAGLHLLADKNSQELVTIVSSLERLKPGPKQRNRRVR